MKLPQISHRTVLAIFGMMSSLAVASPTGNASISNVLLPRWDQKEKAFVKICSGFKFGGYCEKFHAEVIKHTICTTLSDKLLRTESGVSSITIHKAWCRFYSNPYCLYRDAHSTPAVSIELPLGYWAGIPENSEYETFAKNNTGICNLSGFRNIAGYDQWDNRIQAIMCEPWEGLVRKEPTCN